jgi:hypothetical protein
VLVYQRGTNLWDQVALVVFLLVGFLGWWFPFEITPKHGVYLSGGWWRGNLNGATTLVEFQ